MFPKVTVFAGPMFANKTENLLDQVDGTDNWTYYRITRRELEAQESAKFTTHKGREIEGFFISSLNQIETDAKIILVDEAQFAEMQDIVEFMMKYKDRRIFAAGLDLDFARKPWETTGLIMSYAEIVRKLHASCIVCKSPARFSRKLTHNKSRHDEGNHYVPVCDTCYEKDIAEIVEVATATV